MCLDFCKTSCLHPLKELKQRLKAVVESLWLQNQHNLLGVNFDEVWNCCTRNEGLQLEIQPSPAAWTPVWQPRSKDLSFFFPFPPAPGEERPRTVEPQRTRLPADSPRRSSQGVQDGDPVVQLDLTSWGIVCIVSIVSFSNRRPCLERCKGI